MDVFNLGEIIVLEAEDGQTIVRTLKYDDYLHWLEEGFEPGGLWQKNVLGGRP